MPDAWMSWPLGAALLLLAGLIGMAGSGAVLLWRLSRRERRLERQLETLRRRVAQLEGGLPTASGGAVPAPALPTSAPALPTSRPRAWTASPESPAPPLRATLISVPDLGSDGAPPDPQAGDALGRKHPEIAALAEAGATVEEIARQTGQPIGEVELIVGLLRRLHSPRGATEHVRSR